MIIKIVYAVLIGWLVGEIKDFVSNGGFSNILAFNLLRIIGIVFSLVVMVSLSMIASTLSYPNTSDTDDGYDPPRVREKCSSSKSPIRVPRSPIRITRISGTSKMGI
jgi:hypothetical protein